jgi:NAD(P)-dependent dehydrogenase (short-subunit alcohol dehydrogenase family)
MRLLRGANAEQMERQLATSLIGPKNVTRAVLPVMRKQRSVHVISISSGAGLMGFEFNSACGAAKFGLEGGQRRCSPRSPRSASTPPSSTPGFFRTELLTQARGKRYAQGSSRARYESVKSRGSIVDWRDVCMLMPDPLGTWMIRLP